MKVNVKQKYIEKIWKFCIDKQKICDHFAKYIQTLKQLKDIKQNVRN